MGSESGTGTREEPRGSEGVPRGRVHFIALGAITAVAVYLCYRLVEPFLPGLVWAFTLIVLADPVHRRIAGRIADRDAAAATAVTLVVLMIVLPGLLVAAQLVREIPAAGARVEAEVGGGRWREHVGRLPHADRLLPWVEANVKPEDAARAAAGRLAGGVGQLLAGSAWAGLQALVGLFVLFFGLRDRDRLLAAIRRLVPLPPGETEELFGKVAGAVHATVYGTVATGFCKARPGG